MRIRKNAKLSPLLFSSGTGGDAAAAAGASVSLHDTFQTHVCQLNQSPWDVIPFASHSILQFEGEEDSFTANGSLADSIGAVESVASMMDAEDQKPLIEMEDMVVHDNEAKLLLDDTGDRRIAEETTSFCQKTDGKNWHCKNEAKQGQSFCDHHLSLLRSYNNNNSASYNNNNNNNSNNNIASSKKAAAAASATATAAGVRRAKARTAKKASSSSSSNPYEFYYYSGFGPSWGRRRGDRNGEGNNSHRNCNEQLKGVENSTITEAEEETTQNTRSSSASPSPSSSSSSQMDNQEFDYEEDEDDEEEDANGDSGKKRMRKPVKARSLKSLM